MKKCILLFLTFPNFLFGQAANVVQQQSRVNAMNDLMRQNTSSLSLYYNGSEIDIKGSKYFYDAYVDGELWFIDGKYASKEYVYKFDESENSVQTMDKKGEEILVDAEKINGCKLTIEGKAVYYFRAEVPGELNKKRLFQLLYNSDKYNVIKLASKRLVPKTKIFHDDAVQYEYLIEHRYFLKKSAQTYQEVKLKKKDLLKAFPEKQAILKRLFETPQYKERLTELSFVNLLTELELGIRNE